MIANRITLLLAILIVIPLTAAGQTVDSLESLENALEPVFTFEQGQASGGLVAIEKFVFALPADSPLRGDVERKLIDAIDTAETADAKRFLCTQLRVVGTAECVPAVAKLLTDPEVAHMAVYCLGRMDVPEVGKALQDALGKTTGDIQAGILNALADRGQVSIAGECVKLLQADNVTVAKAAARALGRLGAFDVVAPLRKARENAPAALQTEINNALLCTAELLSRKDDSRAVEIYKEFTSEDFSEPLRFAALRGLALTDNAADEYLADVIAYADHRQRRYVISLINLVDGAKATQKFASTLAHLDPDEQVILLRALGARGDTVATRALIGAAKGDQEPVRIAALEALGTAGDASALPTLATAAASSQGLAQQIARASLVKLSGDAVDSGLLKLARDGQAPTQVEAIRALAGRGAMAAVPMLLEAARDSDGQVRTAAIHSLGTLAEADHLDSMVALAIEPVGAEDRGPIADAIGKLFFRMQDRSARSKPLLDVFDSAPTDAQVTLLAILAKSASPEALKKVQSSVTATDPIVRDAAVQALAAWPDTSALQALLDFVGSTTNPAEKEIALKGYVRLAEMSDDPTATYLRVLKHVSTINDRKRVLEGLGLNADSTEALALARKFVDDSQLQATAGLATLRIAHRLRDSHEQLAREALHDVLDKVDHEDVHARAREVLNDLDKYEDHILQWVGAGPFTEEGKDGQAIYNTVFPPEKPEAEDVDWKPITKGIGRWDINLEQTFGGIDYCAAYVRTRVYSPKAQEVLLEMGSDDALRVWLNGELIHEHWKTSGAAPRQEHALARLKEGWNDLMMKVVDHDGGWVFGARLRQPDGAALEGLKFEAR